MPLSPEITQELFYRAVQASFSLIAAGVLFEIKRAVHGLTTKSTNMNVIAKLLSYK